MAKQYPNIGSSTLRKAWATNQNGAPKCMAESCECKATHRVEVQVNWFRGDDEVGNACDAHKKDAAALAVGIPVAREANRQAQRRAEEAKAQRAAQAAQGGE